MTTLEFDVTGMVCQGCSNAVRTMVLSQTGVESATVDHETGKASITGDATMTAAAVHGAIRDGGFGVRACGNPQCACDDCHCDPCAC